VVPPPDDLVQVSAKLLPPETVIHVDQSALDDRVPGLGGVDVRPGLRVCILALVVLDRVVAGKRRFTPIASAGAARSFAV